MNSDMPELLVYAVALDACLAILATEAAKFVTRTWYKDDPPKRAALLRVVSTVAGGSAGLLGVGVIDKPWYLLVALGLGAGFNATLIVYVIKSLLPSRPPPPPPPEQKK